MGISIDEAKRQILEILDRVDAAPQGDSTAAVLDGLPSAGDVESGSEERISLEEMMRLHPVGDCIVPKNLGSLPALSASTTRFRAPSTIDNRDYCLKTLNQGQKPWCAAYTAKMFCEAIKWMERDYPDQNVISAESIYTYAKSIDGDPRGEGTTLTAVLQALLARGIFDSNKCNIQVVRKDGMSRENVKYAIHKFGLLPAAFNCTTEWYLLNPRKTCITGKGSYPVCGGHAVLIDYYDRNGVGFCNSWGEGFGADGHGMMTWKMFDEQFLYAACLTNVFDGLKMNI